MPRLLRSVSVTRALILGAWCSGAALPALAQSSGTALRGTVVVFLPTQVDSVTASRISRAIGGREVVAIYTTDAPTVFPVAKAIHAQFGGSLIPYDRLSRSANDFGDLLFQNAVDYTARKHRGQAVLVVAESDLTLPFLRRAVSPQTLDRELEKAAKDGFVIAVDGGRSVTPLRP
jgi:hypothetical protein